MNGRRKKDDREERGRGEEWRGKERDERATEMETKRKGEDRKVGSGKAEANMNKNWRRKTKVGEYRERGKWGKHFGPPAVHATINVPLIMSGRKNADGSVCVETCRSQQGLRLSCMKGWYWQALRVDLCIVASVCTQWYFYILHHRSVSQA